MSLINAKNLIQKAFQNKYAIPHINIINLEWTRAILETAQKCNSPIILGVSEGAIKYMGGMQTIYQMVIALIADLSISVPIVLHLDHGSFEGAKKALKNGFTSVMYDGSHEDFEINFKNSQIIIDLAKKVDASVELEVGQIGGEEDGISSFGSLAKLEEVQKINTLKPNMIAAGIGNVHGQYPSNWESLSFETLNKLQKFVKTPFVLHGGSGIPINQIQKSISMGISKINVNTELQLASAKAIKEFVLSGKINEDKNYDFRKIFYSGSEAIKKVIEIKIKQFGSFNQA